MWHILTSWVVCVSHMIWIGEIGMELQSGHCKNFERPIWLWPLTFLFWKWYATHPPLMHCRYATYEVSQPNREGATEMTLQKLLITSVTFIWNGWWSFDLFTWNWVTTHRHVMDYICAKYRANRSNRPSYGADMTKISSDPCDLDFEPFDLKSYVPQARTDRQTDGRTDGQTDRQSCL